VGKLTKGQWAYYELDRAMPDKLDVYEGNWANRHKVDEITKYQAMAYRRHWHNTGLWFSVRRANDKWLDIRLVGDIDAYYDDGELPF
jgi:hypothetical protein